MYTGVPRYTLNPEPRVGYAEVTAKIRVMPSCCLILCRVFVRVDGTRVALHDTRWFIDFDAAAGGTAASSPTSDPSVAQAASTETRPIGAGCQLGGWQAVRPAPDGAGDSTGGAAAKGGASALLLCNEQRRGGTMAAVRSALGLPPAEYSSPMLRADAALAAGGAHPTVAERMQRHTALAASPGPAAVTSKAARAAPGDDAVASDGCDLLQKECSEVPPGGGSFHWAIDAGDASALEPNSSATWGLLLGM